jgi:hypothetical protein
MLEHRFPALFDAWKVTSIQAGTADFMARDSAGGKRNTQIIQSSW